MNMHEHVKLVHVIAIGAGGGGACGGGGGGYAEGEYEAQPRETIDILIGYGGTKSTGGHRVDGEPCEHTCTEFRCECYYAEGTPSSFGSDLVVADGGKGCYNYGDAKNGGEARGGTILNM